MESPTKPHFNAQFQPESTANQQPTNLRVPHTFRGMRGCRLPTHSPHATHLQEDAWLLVANPQPPTYR